MPKGLQEKRAGESTKEGLGREVRQRSDVGDGREEESGMTPGLSQDSKGNILSTVETEKLKSGLSEEEGHLANFGQVYARWLNKSPLVQLSPGSAFRWRAGSGFAFKSTPSSHFIPAPFPASSTECITTSAWRQEVMQAVQREPGACLTPLS